MTTRKNRPRTGKRAPLKTLRALERKKRHIKILQTIERYGISDTPHLVALTGLKYKNFAEAINELYHWGLIDRPNNKKYNRDELRDAQVYKKNQTATDWLEAHKLLPKRSLWFIDGGAASHNLKVALAVQSIEWAFIQLGFRFIGWEEILEDAPEETKALPSPWRFSVHEHQLVPDAIFSIEDPDGYTCLFFLEIDLSDHARKEYRLKTELYRDLIFSGIYKRHLNVKQRAAVATITAAPGRHRVMAEMCEKNDPFYFKTIPQYSIGDITPPPSLQMLHGWHWKSDPKPVHLKEAI